MTRLNVGVAPSDLCDQHLMAEYRELPRMVQFSRTVRSIPDVAFTLNRGHMKSCVRYGAHLAERHQALVAEMRHRGFATNMPALTADLFAVRAAPSQDWVAAAGILVRARIVDRLRTMKRTPTWTNRERPAWAATDQAH